ncbi:hypothetical protein [Streptomyces sp. NPDC020489]|uniref:hypothetical protein n=1 Tax=Streptomyces sp. NPDC020489 TaxID=3365077 RepID=UPI0037BD51F3
MDVDQVAGELYALRPQDFVAARDARVAEARRAKDMAAARGIGALRRPTTAAWASNLFVRERPEEAERLLALGQTLREAHRTLDAGQFREASRRQNQMITALVREAAALAQQAGQPLTEPVRHEVEQILHSALADAAVAQEWAAGRLTKAPDATVGFTAVTPDTVPSRPEPRPPKKPPAKRPNRRDTARREQLDAARRAARDAAAEAARSEKEQSRAEQAQESAAARAEQAGARVRELEEQLRQAREDDRAARAAASSARDAAQRARRTATTARRTAARAAEKLAELGEATEGK